MPKPGGPGHLRFSVPIQLKRRGVEAKLVMHAGGQPSYNPDAKLIAVLAECSALDL